MSKDPLRKESFLIMVFASYRMPFRAINYEFSKNHSAKINR